MNDDDLRQGAECGGGSTTSTNYRGEVDPDDPDSGPVGTVEPVDVEDRRKAAEWAERLGLSVSDLAVFCRHGFHYDKIPSKNTPARRSLLAHLKRSEVGPSRWQLISGLYEDGGDDGGYSEVQRRKRLRALYKAVVLLVKRALARHAADALGAERSLYWDPVAEVCRDLEIAQSKLSALCKEFSGHTLIQVVDCVRAERIQKSMRATIRAFVRDHRTQCATLGTDSKGETDLVWEVWAALRTSRRWPQFCQNTWSAGFGFSSYRRMYRACMAVWKQSPHQMELSLIAEELKEAPELSPDVSESEVGLAEIEALLREVQCYAES